MIVLDLSILNQKGTPMFYSDIFANRPTFGIVGRIFISTDTAAIYRDTGTAWDLISDATGAGTNIYNSDGTLTANRTVSSGNFSLTFNPATTFDTTLTAANNASSLSIFGVNRLSYAAGFSANNIGALYGGTASFGLQTFAGSATFANSNIASGGASINSIDFSSAGSTITMTQSSGLRAMTGNQVQVQYQGTNSGTITHAAIQQNLGFYRPSAATGTLTITNAYSHLINALDDYGAGFTFTNRWGIYQAGSSDTNYFAASTLIGTTINTGEKLIVGGSGIFNGLLATSAGNAITAGGGSFLIVPTATRGVINLGGSTDNFLTFSNNGYIGSGSNYLQINAQTGRALSLVSDGSTALTFSLSGNAASFAGNVGIGDSNPLYKLSILDAGGASIVVGATTGTAFLYADNAAATIGTITSTPLRISTNNTEIGRFTPSGNLQLGTTSGGNWRFLCFQDSSTGSASSAAFMARQNGTDDVAQFWVSGSNIASIKSTGNLLINSTSDPGQKLYLNGSLRIDGQTSGSAGGSSGQHLIINCDGTTYKIALLNN